MSYDLDLDLLEPQPKHVKLGGKVHKVYPPKVKQLNQLARLAGQLNAIQDTPEQGTASLAALDEMIGIMSEFMPSLKEKGVDINVDQMIGLINFVNTMVATDEQGPLKETGVKISTGGDQKKTASAS